MLIFSPWSEGKQCLVNRCSLWRVTYLRKIISKTLVFVQFSSEGSYTI